MDRFWKVQVVGDVVTSIRIAKKAQNPQSQVAVFLATIYGQVASKANSRRQAIGKAKDGHAFIRTIKSDAALAWLQAASYQVQQRDASRLLQGALTASIRIWYDSERPDLDESLLLDFLQGRAYMNDRQVRERHVYHAIDKARPRCTILITPIADIELHIAFMRSTRQSAGACDLVF